MNENLSTEANVVVAATAVVAADVKFTGPFTVTIGEGTVIHPKCEFRSLSGPIIVGNDNIFEERSIIENSQEGTEDKPSEDLVIGSNNVFQVDSQFKGNVAGDANVFEAKSLVDVGCRVGTGCVVGHSAKLSEEKELMDSHVAYRFNSFTQGMETDQVFIRSAKRLKEHNLSELSSYLLKMQEIIAKQQQG
mmetsp:Transcript_16162/g.21238  ORF Transcript_16162/g.21238 Transcript_16162/m.21238 type:complete len:191 (+) Transcript_16162:130-702(+)